LPDVTDGTALAGGNVAASVVRVGDTVRKPAGPHTPAVHALLEHLRAAGFTGAPRSFGVDDDGRHVLEYVPGTTVDGAALDPRVVGRLARDLHDTLDGWTPPPDAAWGCPIPADGAELVIHNDLAPWNLVVGDGRLVLVDWDTAGPGTRTWDLAWLALGLVPLRPGTPDDVVLARLGDLAEGYDLDDDGRARLAATLAPRAWSMHDLLARGAATGEQPWARLWDAGHGGYWRRDAEWADGHGALLRRALA
jgi:hypothetical protein